jgi:hypothetical protein
VAIADLRPPVDVLIRHVLKIDGAVPHLGPVTRILRKVRRTRERDQYRYVSEAWGGYHFNVSHGLNIDAGIFVSYVGLFSYYNFDNRTYQPSYVSNTPWYFNGVRVQWFLRTS